MIALTLVVKGDPEQAIRAALGRGFKILDKYYHDHGDTDTVLKVIGEEQWAMMWFMEPGSAPFPAGSLLYYKHTERA